MKLGIVVGASGGIGAAVLKELRDTGGYDAVYAISRSSATDESDSEHWLQSDYTEQSIQDCVSAIKSEAASDATFDIVIATGILHDGDLQPEKRLEQFDAEHASHVFRVNTFLPIAWVKGLSTLFERKSSARIVVLSARVGSIGDNHLGGWYSYRASKAALNMMMKTMAVEFARRYKGVKLIAFHPGTTETPLSAPFRGQVPAEKLFKPSFVAECLVSVMNSAECDGELSYLAWDGKSIPW